MNTSPVRPYEPSWVDRLIAWLERLPIPIWLIYLLIGLLAATYIHLVYWAEGIYAWGQIVFEPLINGIWIPLPLAALHYLKASGRQAAHNFRKAMDSSESEYQNIAYQIQTIPAAIVWAFNAILFILFFIASSLNPGFLDPRLNSSLVPLLISLYASIGFSLTFLIVYLTIHQLRLVSRMYALVDEVNIFNVQPLYVLSKLTAKTAIILIVIANLTLIYNVLLEIGLSGMDTRYFLALIAVEVAFALLAFLVPLLGIHGRLDNEKDTVLEENSHLLEDAYAQLRQRFRENELQEMSQFRHAVNSLLTFRREIEATSTWPWEPATLRNVLSAVLLPLFLYLTQQVLSQLLGL